VNNKGFTLIELLATIILLALIMTVTTTSVIGIMNKSKEESYKILIDNIKIGAQEYFEECENNNIIESAIPSATCDNLIRESEYCQRETAQPEKCATISLESLLQYGFLTGNTIKDETGNEIKIVENPITNENMNSCKIEVLKYYDSNNSIWWYEFEANSYNGLFCPKTEELAN